MFYSTLFSISFVVFFLTEVEGGEAEEGEEDDSQKKKKKKKKKAKKGADEEEEEKEKKRKPGKCKTKRLTVARMNCLNTWPGQLMMIWPG